MLYASKPDGFIPDFEVVAAYVERGSEILLLLRSERKPQGGTYCLPAGKVEDGETKEQALCRELKEEIGYETDPLNLKFIETVYVEYPEYKYFYHMFRIGLPDSHIVRINRAEHQSYCWRTPSEALKLPLIQEQDVCIKRVYGLP